MKPDALARLNPWWERQDGFARNAARRAFDALPLRFERPELERLPWRKDAVYTLRGPRQVGKTTLLRAWLARAADEGVDRRHLLYYSCEMETEQSLYDTLALWLDPRGDPPPRRLVVLDEVAEVRSWPLVLRRLHAEGLLESVTVVASGSHALDLRGSGETLPGRRGAPDRARTDPPLDRILWPASFRQYALARHPHLARDRQAASALASPWQQASSPRMARHVRGLAPHAQRLASAFEEYLLCGGFPAPANALARGGEIPPEVFREAVGASGTGLARLGLSAKSAGQVARRIVDVRSNPVSWEAVASGTDLRSHVTAKSYVEALVASYLVLEVPPMDLSKKRPVWQRERKLYASDPFLLHALRAWGTPSIDPDAESREWTRDPSRRGHLVETAVMANLAFGAAAGILGGAETWERLTYLRTGGGREVDAIVSSRGKRTPVEVKTGDPAKVDRKAMSLVGPGVIVTADSTDLRARPREIAAPLFLYLLPGVA